MLKILVGAAALSLLTVGASYAAPAGPYPTARPATHRVLANGRCDGVSYGTGARRCNSASGGPSGGLSSRN